MERARLHWPLALLAFSLAILGRDALETTSVDYSRDVEGFCRDNPQGNAGKRLQLKVKNQTWTWVSCKSSPTQASRGDKR